MFETKAEEIRYMIAASPRAIGSGLVIWYAPAPTPRHCVEWSDAKP